MQDSLKRLAYLAVRQSYPKDKYIILGKTHYIPTKKPLNWKLLELINPEPKWCSTFLVINKNKNCNPYDKLRNIWVRFGETGHKVNGVYNGQLHIPKSWLKHILDDRQLHGNLVLNDGTIITNSNSNVIFVVSHLNGQKFYISKSIDSRAFVIGKEGYYDPKFREEYKEGLKAKQLVDNRPIERGNVLTQLATYYENTDDLNYYTFDKVTKSISMWWRMTGLNTEELYPVCLTDKEVSEICPKISTDALDTTVGVCKSDTIEGKKKLCYEKIPEKWIAEVYDSYIEKGAQYHTAFKGVDLTRSMADWIKRHHPTFPLFPIYHWAWARYTLFNEFSNRIN